MITITKNIKDDFMVEYKLEVYKDNILIYHSSVDISKHGITDEQRDKVARLQLMKTLLHDGYVEIFEELGNLIPLYEE